MNENINFIEQFPYHFHSLIQSMKFEKFNPIPRMNESINSSQSFRLQAYERKSNVANNVIGIIIYSQITVSKKERNEYFWLNINPLDLYNVVGCNLPYLKWGRQINAKYTRNGCPN